MIRSVFTSLALFSLTGCHILFPEDPRLGVEPEEECVARMEQDFEKSFHNKPKDGDPIWVPTFTYDVTKLSLEALQALSVNGADETAGTRWTLSSNETSTAVAQFMAESVGEDGAFFLGHDPALYRVRGEPTSYSGGIAAGCERQQENMRLMSIEYTSVPKPEPEADIETAETEPQNAPTQNAPTQNESQ